MPMTNDLGQRQRQRQRQRSLPGLYLKRALLALLSLAVSALFCEGLLRLLWHNPYLEAEQEPVVRLRIHLPLQDVPVDRGAIYPDSPTVAMRVDERGYVRPSRRFADPDATIAFLGGSTTECAAVDEELRFPAMVSRLLEERRGLRVNTLNAGTSGNTAHDSLNLLINHVVADRPDVVIMMHATNDIGNLSRRGSYRLAEPSDGRAVLLWLIRASSGYSSLIAALRRWLRWERLKPRPFEERIPAPGQQVEIAADQFVARLRAFVRVARAFGIEPVLMTQPESTVRTPLSPDWLDLRKQEQFNGEIRRVAAEEGAVLIDLVRHLFDHVEGWDEPMKVFYDGVHVTNTGSRIYAEHIAERLAESVLASRLAAAADP